jgi:putative transposase
VSRLCRVLEVSMSGYYDWRSRPVSAHAQRDAALKTLISASHKDSYGIYGSPRIYKDLKERGEVVSRKRVARLMQEEQLIAKAVRAFKRTTCSEHDLPLAPNLLAQNFTATRPNQRWVSDITYIRTEAGWLYLAAVMDLFSRAIVGFAMDKHMTVDLVSRALLMALSRREIGADLMLHSDRGSQYAAEDYQAMLKRHGIRCSMSGVGNCYDNAAMESFFHSLKSEWVYHNKYSTRQEAKASLFEYIEVFYNRKRRHSYVNQMAPMQFEKHSLAA